MESLGLNTGTIIIIIVLFIICVYITVFNKYFEHLDEQTGRYCPSCDKMSFGQCLQCYNCGFCASGHKGRCMKGTAFGRDPVDKKNDDFRKCRWYHNDTFWRNAFKDDAYKCIDRGFNN